MKLITAGKKTPSIFFEKSGIRSKKKLKHHPAIAFINKDGKVKVEIVDSPEALVKLPMRTKVMAQWPGKTRSDYFKFSVAQLREHIANNPKQDKQVI